MCGSENKEGDSNCAGCGASLPGAHAKPEPEKVNDCVVCFTCGAENDRFNSNCSHCQMPLPKPKLEPGVVDPKTGKVTCLMCGAENDPTNTICTSCESAMPTAEEQIVVNSPTPDRKAPAGTQTGRYQQFVVAVDKVKLGQWGPLELANWLQEMTAVLATRAAEFVQIIHGSNYYEVQSREVESCFAGMEQYEDGMQELWKFIDDGDANHLENGLETIWEGNKQINQAILLNRNFRRELEEEWGFM
jgi:hypothetical protein